MCPGSIHIPFLVAMHSTENANQPRTTSSKFSPTAFSIVSQLRYVSKTTQTTSTWSRANDASRLNCADRKLETKEERGSAFPKLEIRMADRRHGPIWLSNWWFTK